MRFARAVSLLACISVFQLLVGSPARATTVLRFSDDALVRNASRIIEGTVQSVRCAWNAEHNQIQSFVEISVAAAYKGEMPPNNILSLTLVGGRVGDDVMEIVGAPVFTQGEVVILFLDRNPSALVPIVGLYQGKLTVTTDAKTGVRTIQGRTENHDAFVTRVRNLVTLQAKEGDNR